jgi:PAS domain S-box-containing protein
MSSRPLAWLLRYGSALFLVALALPFAWLLRDTSVVVPYLLLCGGVAVAARWLGLGAGLLAAAAAVVAADYFFLAPLYSFRIEQGRDAVALGLFALTTLLVGLLAGARRRRELREAQQQRQQAEEHAASLAAIVESSDDAVIRTTPDGVIATWHAGAEKIYGYTPEEAVGQPASLLAPPERRDEFVQLLHRLQRGESVGRTESVRRRKDARLIHVALTVSPIRDAAGRVTGYAVIGRDITERKRAEEELRQAKDAAEAANRAKSAFLAKMSHELRTPLNGILGMTELTLDTALSAEQRDYLETVKTSVGLLERLIDDVLDYSRMEAGQVELKGERFALRASLAEMMNALLPSAHARGLELTWQVADDAPDALVGDVGRLRQVLGSLVGNAIKFTERGGVTVDASAFRAGSVSDGGKPVADASGSDVWLRFEIRDTGIGIAPEQQRRIFDAFTQADDSSTRRFGGAGLGLALAAQLVRSMGGRIEVKSEEGKGSTFSFTARLARAPSDPEA